MEKLESQMAFTKYLKLSDMLRYYMRLMGSRSQGCPWGPLSWRSVAVEQAKAVGSCYPVPGGPRTYCTSSYRQRECQSLLDKAGTRNWEVWLAESHQQLCCQ